MLRVVAFSTMLFALVPVAHAEPSTPRRASVSVRYRMLDKMLRRFSRQAGTPSTGRVLASR
jgi:hypothetical protein